MSVAVVIVALSVTVSVMCHKACLVTPRQKSLKLTCLGKAEYNFRHIYWKSGRANDLIANCYDSNKECYIYDTRRYRAIRDDPTDTTFQSSLTINDVSNNIVIKCFLWVAGRKDEVLINTTRVLVDGDCDEQDVEEFSDTNSTTAPTSATIVNTIRPMTGTEQNHEISIGEVKYDNDSSECQRVCYMNLFQTPIALVMIFLLLAIVSIVWLILLTWKRALRLKPTIVIPFYTDSKDLPQANGHSYSNLIFSADEYNLSSTLPLPLPPRPIRPCHDELHESPLHPPAYSEIYEIRSLLNDVQTNESLTPTVSLGQHRQRIGDDQLQDATTRQYYRVSPTMKLQQIFQYKQNSTEPISHPPDYNTSIRLKPPH